jgi:hypothetical protein
MASGGPTNPQADDTDEMPRGPRDLKSRVSSFKPSVSLFAVRRHPPRFLGMRWTGVFAPLNRFLPISLQGALLGYVCELSFGLVE